MLNIKLNREALRDKIYACWVGKNIGGTIGGPYEGKREMLDIKGFATEKGEPLPNDDLDLQLVWLDAMRRVGPGILTANDLAEMWLTVIAPHWNEYGVGKGNIRQGLMPPMCGEYENDAWKHSNGAWIRSEIWACLAPGFPKIALKYALMDASIDHGMGEGTYAEIFTTALESYAFAETDIRKIIEAALTYIPGDCRVAQCVKKVIEEYDKKTDYREVRNMLVKMTEDLGWFQSPANVGYVVIGLMYGEGDFKKSMIYAVNCGDDTDCTAATVGSFLGILYGMKGIPTDWQEYIGDRIMTICINASYRYTMPQTCTELTQKVMEWIPSVLMVHDVYMEYTDGESEIDKEAALEHKFFFDKDPEQFFENSPYSFSYNNGRTFSDVTVDFGKPPVIKAGETLKFKYTYKNMFQESFNADVKLFLPDGWTAEYNKSINLRSRYDGIVDEFSTYEVAVTAGETVLAKNELVLYIKSSARALPVMVPITILG